jgi:hypothetical protein
LKVKTEQRKQKMEAKQMFTKEQLERVKDRVETETTRNKKTGCWIWNGARASQRSPIMEINGKKISVRRAAYLAYKLKPPLEDRAVTASCRNPLCVNPGHMERSNHQRGGRKKGTRPKYPRHRYPWAEWFSKESLTLVKGEDFHCQTHGMITQLRSASFRYNVSLSLSVQDNGNIEVEVRPRDKKFYKEVLDERPLHTKDSKPRPSPGPPRTKNVKSVPTPPRPHPRPKQKVTVS